jgi:hypothetical protein
VATENSSNPKNRNSSLALSGSLKVTEAVAVLIIRLYPSVGYLMAQKLHLLLSECAFGEFQSQVSLPRSLQYLANIRYVLLRRVISHREAIQIRL